MKSRTIPKGVLIIPNIPEDDYFSNVSGVYYHFGKQEWRTTCKDPLSNSKRWQKTFGVKKYGFYEAKQRAEATNVASKQQRILMLFSDVKYQKAIAYNMVNHPKEHKDVPFLEYSSINSLSHGCPYCKCNAIRRGPRTISEQN